MIAMDVVGSVNNFMAADLGSVVTKYYCVFYITCTHKTD